MRVLGLALSGTSSSPEAASAVQGKATTILTPRRVLGAAPRGGLRIDGGQSGFTERTVSLQDIAWVIVAAEDVREHGGVLDEERVNRLRYLEGTPKGSTRWIDTGWALAAWDIAKGLVREPVGAASPLLRVHKPDGNALDASFRLERVGEALTIIFESRGGTRGSTAERNVDYNPGLELILERLRALGLTIADVLVESKSTADLAADERRVRLDGESFPIAVADPAALRRKISAAQARVGRAEGAKGGGNQTRRLRIFLSGPKANLAASDLSRALARGA